MSPWFKTLIIKSVKYSKINQVNNLSFNGTGMFWGWRKIVRSPGTPRKRWDNQMGELCRRIREEPDQAAEPALDTVQAGQSNVETNGFFHPNLWNPTQL